MARASVYRSRIVRVVPTEQPMRRFRVVDCTGDIWTQKMRIVRSRSVERVLEWCFQNGYDLVEEVFD